MRSGGQTGIRSVRGVGGDREGGTLKGAKIGSNNKSGHIRGGIVVMMH